MKEVYKLRKGRERNMQICSQIPTLQNQGLSEPQNRSKLGTSTRDDCFLQDSRKHPEWSPGTHMWIEKLKSTGLCSRMFGKLFITVKNKVI